MLAFDSLTGLSVGDAFGDQFFLLANRGLSADEGVPPAPWEWSDDTEMACSVVDVLFRLERIDQDALMAAFAARFDVSRRYGVGALELLEAVRKGAGWRGAAAESFAGKGSYGNGAAMRVAPLGAWFHDDLSQAAGQAALSAEVTHTNQEGIAGGVAVAVAAAQAAAWRLEGNRPGDLLDVVLEHTPPGYVRRGLERARRLRSATRSEAAGTLGNGSRITAQDTVPFALWTAARHLGDYEAAIRTCAAAGGDMDTTAAIAGGVVAAHLGADAIPEAWRRAREPLPHWLT
jgi:ADP-ribosylglycohydrolase